MTISIPVAEIDELLQYGITEHLGLDHDARWARYLEELVGLLRKGVVQFKDQTVYVPTFSLHLLETEARAVTFVIDTRLGTAIEKLRGVPGITIEEPELESGSCIWTRIKQKFSTHSYPGRFDLNAIAPLREKMDKVGLTLKTVTVSAQEVRLVMAVKQRS